jgi:cystathionine beta-lyase
MWVADMDFAAPPAVVEAVRARAAHGAYGYPSVPAGFWEAAIAWQKNRFGWDVERDWMIHTPGVVPSLHFGVRAFSRPGEAVIIQTPVYFPFYSAVERNGRRLVRNPLRFDGGRWTMDLDGLARSIDAGGRLLILCHPHNPVGRAWTAEELGRLGELAGAGGVTIISDEIHGDLVFGGRRHVPLASLSADLARRTDDVPGPSKTFNVPGWRPPWLSSATRCFAPPSVRGRALG